MVVGNDHLAVQRLAHAQNVRRGHLVGDAARVLAVAAQRHVNGMFVAVLGVAVGIVRITAVVNAAARCLDEVIDRHIVHVRWHFSLGGLACGNGQRHGAVKGFEHHDLDIADFHHITRADRGDAFARHTPFEPDIGAGLRTDEGHAGRTVLEHGGGHVDVDVVVVRVRGEHGVNLADGKRVDDKGRDAQVALQFDAAGHARHLVVRVHQRVLHAAFAGAAPEVDADVGVAFALDPDAGAGQPPHRKGAGLDHLALDLFIEPGTPLRKGAQNPRFLGDFIHFCHVSLLLTVTEPWGVTPGNGHFDSIIPIIRDDRGFFVCKASF